MSLHTIRYSDERDPASTGEIGPVTRFDKEWVTYGMALPPDNDSFTVLRELELIEALLRYEYPIRRQEIERQDKAEQNPDDPNEEGVIEKEFYNLLAARNVSVPREVRVDLAKYNIDLVSIVQYFKQYFDRPRPYQLFNALGRVAPVPASETAHTPAYPSGHALLGRFCALYLGDLYPMHAASLMALGDRITANRVIAGHHYPSDSVAGQELAEFLWDNRI